MNFTQKYMYKTEWRLNSFKIGRFEEIEEGKLEILLNY